MKEIKIPQLLRDAEQLAKKELHFNQKKGEHMLLLIEAIKYRPHSEADVQVLKSFIEERGIE